MSLMISVSGVRGIVGRTMTPALAADLGCAFGSFLAATTERPRVIVARDTRPSGPMLHSSVAAGLLATGCEVIDLGVVSTPGAALMIRQLTANGGVVITASHNPAEWNGIKFLTSEGLAPPPGDAQRIIQDYERKDFRLVGVDQLGELISDDSTHARHVSAVVATIDPAAIATAKFKVVLDSVNGAAGTGGRMLLENLGCQVVHINADPTGRFTHPPEPLAEHLSQLCRAVSEHRADVGFAQDPDGDRLAIVDETGRYVGEECTLALAAKHLFAKRPGPAATNLSTSRMIDDLAAASDPPCVVHRAPVGEANVVAAMKAHSCVFGGEGNGGVIDPQVVPVRDSFVAMANVLELMAGQDRPLSCIVDELPRYAMSKQKLECPRERIPAVLAAVRKEFADQQINDMDGVRADLPSGWVHIRPSNTEPILRIIAEARDEAAAQRLAARARRAVVVA